MSTPNRGAERRQSVLLVHERGVEWMSSRDEGEQHASVDVGGAEPNVDAIADAAARACGLCGGSKRRVVLALGEGLVRHRLVELPIPIARSSGGEIDHTLHRKAAALLGCEARDALFAAALVDPGSEGRDDARPTSWLVSAFRRRFVPALLRALRRNGISVHRVASLRLCGAGGASARRTTLKGACIVVAVESACVTLTLVHEGLVVNVGALRGSFAEEPALAMTLLQEIKGLDIHWRKQSRGESVSEIVLLGFPHDRGELLVSALKNAHKDMAVTVPRDADGTHAPDVASRVELLRTCRSITGIPLDLTPRARAHRARRFALAGAALAVTGAFAWGTWDASRAARREREHVLAQLEARGADLERLQGRATEVRSAIEQLNEAVERRRQVAQAGIELGTVLDAVRASFGAGSSLTNLRLTPSEGATLVEIEGEASAQPIRAATSIARLERALEDSPVFESVEVSAAPLPTSESEPVRFRMSARLEGGG